MDRDLLRENGFDAAIRPAHIASRITGLVGIRVGPRKELLAFRNMPPGQSALPAFHDEADAIKFYQDAVRHRPDAFSPDPRRVNGRPDIMRLDAATIGKHKFTCVIKRQDQDKILEI